MPKPNLHVCVVGDLDVGFSVHGPFDSFGAASGWADNHVNRVMGEQSWIMELHVPLPAYYVTHEGSRVRVDFAHYENGRVALRLLDDDGGLYITATVNVPDRRVDPGEVVIREYSEGAGLLKALMDGGVVGAPTRWIEEDFVKMPVCKLTVPEVLWQKD